jgi:hypothetical protein
MNARKLSQMHGSTLQTMKIEHKAAYVQCASMNSAISIKPQKWAMDWKTLQALMNIVKPLNSSTSSMAPIVTAITAIATSLQEKTLHAALI